MMGCLDDAIDDGVAEVHVIVGHVELGPQHHRALDGLRRVHFLEQLQVLFHGPVAVGAVGSRRGGGAFLCGNLLRGLLIDVGQTLANEPNGEVPQLLKVVGGVINIAPFESQPADVVQNILHIFRVFLGRIGVVEAQVAHSVVSFGHAEVHANGLGMADMEVSVGLRGEASLDASAVLSLCQILLYELFHEAQTPFFFTRIAFLNVHIPVN